MGKKKRNSQPHRLRNWPEYNRALVKRGDLTLWFSDDLRSQWNSPSPSFKKGALKKGALKKGTLKKEKRARGRPQVYSDQAIECLIILREIYHLPLRALVGSVRSIFRLAAIGLQVPDYTTLSRRMARLNVRLPVTRRSEPLHLVFDSTGLKVMGEGEWKVKKHGPSKHRRWLKVHLAVDGERGINPTEIRAVVISTNSTTDWEAFPLLLEAETSPVAQCTGDSAYDTWNCYRAADARGAQAVFPPPKRTAKQQARIKQHGNSRAPPLQRDEHIRSIRKIGRQNWKEEVGYHRRSLSETAVYRFKLFGDRVKSRKFPSQGVEGVLRCKILNIWSTLGMPDSYRVA